MAARRSIRRAGALVCAAVLVLLAVVDGLLGRDVVLSAGYAVAALLAATMTTVRITAVFAVAAVCLVAVSGVWNEDLAAQEWWIRLGFTSLLGMAAIVSARIRTQREKALQDMTLIAETAQRALLRSLPTQVGSVGLAARYISATRAARMGGDLYEVAETPYGVRAIVGDVRGKGLDAVQLAAAVLGGFRRAAFIQPRLADVALELDRVVHTVAGEEDFVTAVLAEFHGDAGVGLVNCGHHPPVMVAEGRLQEMPTGEPQLPLGLGTAPQTVLSAWPATARLLLFTDGLIETRNARGEFFPLDAHGHLLIGGSLDEALDRLLARLSDHAGGQLSDDIALVLAEHQSAASAPSPGPHNHAAQG
jgi:phosphoserine phosphatase RsbU/P